MPPGAQIILGEGEFRLNTASDYGQRKGPYYIWNDLGQGNYELQLQYVEGLTIRGAGKGKTSLTTDPRWANVISIVDSENITLEDMTLGHTELAEACEGGVIRLKDVEEINLQGLGLYGCGTLGVSAYECEEMKLDGCEIYDCSYGAVSLSQCEEVFIRNASVHSIGRELPAQQLFSFWGCEDVTISDSEISGNYVQTLISAEGVEKLIIRSNQFIDNRLSDCAFQFGSRGVVLDGNSFEGTQPRNWYGINSQPGMDRNGKDVIFEQPEPIPVTPGEATPVSTGEQKQVKVKNADDFLKAIASDTCITLDGKLLDLSKTESCKNAVAHFEGSEEPGAIYREEGNDRYYWQNHFDGPSLILTGISNLTIQGKSDDRTKATLSAVPRYADVLTFENCAAITLSCFTAGHTEEPGQCDGGVFKFVNSDNILIENCGMYGCGTEGVFGDNSRNIQIVGSEIYECSYNAVVLNRCDTVAISDTIIRDIGTEWTAGWAVNFSFWDSSNVTLDGEALDGNYTGN